MGGWVQRLVALSNLLLGSACRSWPPRGRHGTASQPEDSADHSALPLCPPRGLWGDLGAAKRQPVRTRRTARFLRSKAAGNTRPRSAPEAVHAPRAHGAGGRMPPGLQGLRGTAQHLSQSKSPLRCLSAGSHSLRGRGPGLYSGALLGPRRPWCERWRRWHLRAVAEVDAKRVHLKCPGRGQRETPVGKRAARAEGRRRSYRLLRVKHIARRCWWVK